MTGLEHTGFNVSGIVFLLYLLAAALFMFGSAITILSWWRTKNKWLYLFCNFMNIVGIWLFVWGVPL